MRAASAILGLVAIAGVGFLVLWKQPPAPGPSAPQAERAGEGGGADARAARTDAPAAGANAAEAPLPAPGSADATENAAGTRSAGRTGDGARSAWPSARRARSAPGAAPAAEPAVPTTIAFRALWYLGTDPEAEKTWVRAINDLNTPPGVRSDLIVDMIDEGYTDNNRPGKADLPVILARLEILERHAPYAIDEVNAKAFAEAYRTMLDLYVRLGGVRSAR